jgi:hypothetical protein
LKELVGLGKVWPIFDTHRSAEYLWQPKQWLGWRDDNAARILKAA